PCRFDTPCSKVLSQTATRRGGRFCRLLSADPARTSFSLAFLVAFSTLPRREVSRRPFPRVDRLPASGGRALVGVEHGGLGRDVRRKPTRRFARRGVGENFRRS